MTILILEFALTLHTEFGLAVCILCGIDDGAGIPGVLHEWMARMNSGDRLIDLVLEKNKKPNCSSIFYLFLDIGPLIDILIELLAAGL